MGPADALIFALLALFDLALIVALRKLRARHRRTERVTRSLRLAVQRAIQAT